MEDKHKKPISFMGWLIILGLFYFFTKSSRAGRNIVYYSLLLILILLLVGNYQAINNTIYKDE